MTGSDVACTVLGFGVICTVTELDSMYCDRLVCVVTVPVVVCTLTVSDVICTVTELDSMYSDRV